jgi:hypothetical protein
MHAQQCARAQENDGDPDRIPPWIRAHFVMEERWGELEAEYFAAKEAVKLAEAWGTVSRCASASFHRRPLPELAHANPSLLQLLAHADLLSVPHWPAVIVCTELVLRRSEGHPAPAS